MSVMAASVSVAPGAPGQPSVWAGDKAVAQLSGNAVYINASFWGGGASADLTTVMHELIHNVTGLTDDDIMAKFGLSLDQLLANNKCP